VTDQVYRVKDPTGVVREIRGPAGASDAEVIAQAQKLFGGGGETESPYSPRNIAGAAIEPNLSLLSGAVATPIAGLVGLGQAAKNIVSPGMDPVERVQQRQEALTYKPQTEGGKTALEAISYPFKKLAGFAGEAGGAVSDVAGPAAGATVSTAIQAAPALLGVKGPKLSGALETAQKGITGTGEVLGSVADLVRKEGPSNILTRGQRRLVGDEKVAKVVDALRSAKELVPGSKPTVAEALAGVPEGSPLQAHQQIISRTPGGLSAEFGQMLADRIKARADAITERERVTRPMREKALAGANASGGVKTRGLLSEIGDLKNAPGSGANDVIGKTLSETMKKIKGLSSKGVIDARELYTIHETIGNTIAKYAEENESQDQHLAAGLEHEVQHLIDNAVERAGGTGWKDYLSEFSRRSQAIADDLSRMEASRKPLQRTSVPGTSIDPNEAAQHLLPTILSRPIMGTRFVAHELAKRIQPKVDALAARRYFNPQELADSLSSGPSASPLDLLIHQLLMRSVDPAAMASMIAGQR
jgi:hypothetical protein